MDRLDVGTCLVEGRYCLSRILARGSVGLLYVANTPGDPRTWVVKELRHGLEGRAERLAELPFQRLAPALAPIVSEGRSYLVHEYVEGVPVAALARMRRAPLTRDEVLEEALRIVEDLVRVEKAGIPVSGRVLEPDHVLLDRGGHLRPVNALPTDADQDAGGNQLCGRVGDLVSALLPALPPDLAWFVSRCHGYHRLEQVEQALRELHAPAHPEEPAPAPRPPKRRLWLLLLGLPLLAPALMAARSGPAPLPARAAVLSFADRVEIRDADTLALSATRRGTPSGSLLALRPDLIAGALPTGLALFAPGQSPTPALKAVVGEMATDADGRWLAATEPSAGVVSLQPVAPLLGERPRSRPYVVSAAGPGVRVAVGRADAGGVPALFVADPRRRTVTRYGMDPATLEAEAPLADVGALLVSSGGTHLDVALPSLREVRRLDAATLRPRGPSARLPGRPLHLAAVPGAVAVLDDTGAVTFLDADTLAKRGTLRLGARPVATSGALWVATERDLVALDPARRKIRARAPLAHAPSGLAVLAADPLVRSDEGTSPPGGGRLATSGGSALAAHADTMDVARGGGDR